MTPPRPPTDPRELAARALCRKAGNPENTMFEGKPMWMSYLKEVDVVLEAVGWRRWGGGKNIRAQAVNKTSATKA